MSSSAKVSVLFLISLTLGSSARAVSLHAGFQQWLDNLRTFVNQNVSCFFNNGPHNVQLSHTYETLWSSSVSPSSNWKDYASTTTHGLDLLKSAGGVMISSVNAHVPKGDGAFNARISVDGVPSFHNDIGAFYAAPTTSSAWFPFNFVQMKDIACGGPSNDIHIQIQTRSPQWSLGGLGHSAAILPRPAFLSSLESPLISANSSNRPPEAAHHLKHTIEVKSQRALLIMAANARIKGTSGETSLTYTVNNYSPTGQHGRDYGFYHVTANVTSPSAIHMGLYQLAEVYQGFHTVQLEGKGSPFDLEYATSQVAYIPVDVVQLKTVTADWAVTLDTRDRTVLSTAIAVTEDSLLVMASTFEIGAYCGSHWVYLRHKVDDTEPPATSFDVDGILDAFHVSRPSNTFIPGSFLNFAKVTKGYHRIALHATVASGCAPVVKRAALQVGVIPQSY